MHGGHPRFELVGEVPRQEADLLPPDGNQRPIHRDPPIATQFHDLLERSGEGKVRLAGTRHTHHRHGGHIRIHEQIEGKSLSHVLGFDAEHVTTAGHSRHGCWSPVVHDPTQSRL